MEKLLALLNQFEKYKKSGFTWRSIDSYDNCVYGVDCDGETEITMYSDLYSKYYGFIEWLVENDKIDYKKLLENSNFIEIKSIGWGIAYSLTMLLSIKDNPIEFLVSILK